MTRISSGTDICHETPEASAPIHFPLVVFYNPGFFILAFAALSVSKGQRRCPVPAAENLQQASGMRNFQPRPVSTTAVRQPLDIAGVRAGRARRR